jgi:hypothetical protein
MRSQQRWRCRECFREWAYAHEWNECNCPACGSPEIERVEFKGLFDINTPPAISAALEATEPMRAYGGVVVQRGSKASADPFTPLALRTKEQE